MQSGFFEHNGGSIFYQIDGVGQPLVFIHGFSLDSRIWIGQIDYFSQNYQVITYDMRGFGKSSPINDNYSHHEDLHALLKHLGIQPVVLIGLSLGGEVAIDFTLQYPDKVSKLILADSSLSGYSSTVDWNVHAKEVGVEKAKENWLNHQVFAPTSKNISASRVLKHIISDYSGWHWLNQDTRIKPTPQAVDRLIELKIPVLIMVGQLDLDYFHTIAQRIKGNAPNSTQVTIPNSGHMVNLENPDVFNRTVEDFIRKI
jgi:pimeloyl-ACP methyl ester carboxylesterase